MVFDTPYVDMQQAHESIERHDEDHGEDGAVSSDAKGQGGYYQSFQPAYFSSELRS